ncbi:MAG TPA: multidrug effflux MFS transporter [Accumulibacter sp.]|nr:multidrug effflux MFS transporter [Accumulibacter sp.]
MYELPKVDRKRIIATPRGLAILLAALVAVGPFSVDAYLPSFVDIASSLQSTPWQVQQTLTAYLLTSTLMTLWHGAISDAVGRRRLLLATVILYALASLGCMLAPSIGVLWLFRAIQGMTAGAGIIVGRAIVRDLYQGAEGQRVISQIMMIFALAPVIAPIFGGWLQAWFGWRSVFAFLLLFSATLAVICWFHLPETLPSFQRRSLKPRDLTRSYRQVLTSLPFLRICFALAFNFAGFFVYIVSAPVFLISHLHLSSTSFLWLFGPAMTGLLIGSFLAGRFAGILSPLKSIVIGYALMTLAVVANVGISLSLQPGLPWSILPLFGFTLGMALLMPCLTLMALDLFPEQRGLAASCQMFIQSACNTLVAGIVAPLLWGSTLYLACSMGVFMLLGALAIFSQLKWGHEASFQAVS